MTTIAMVRALSCSRVAWRVQGRGAGKTTARWQDKRAHIVRRSGGCFCRIFQRAAHIATLARNVRRKPKALHPFELSHFAGLRHGR